MKLVITTINPNKLEEVRDALTHIGIHELTATEVNGDGQQTGQMEIYRGAEYVVNFLRKVRIEVAVAFEQVAEVVETIAAAAETGPIGGGIILVTPIEQALRIRTVETGPASGARTNAPANFGKPIAELRKTVCPVP